MRPEFWHHRRSGEGFNASRPLYALPASDWGRDPEAQLATMDARHRHDLGEFLEDPARAERAPDEALPDIFSQLWRKANATCFEQQDAECAAYQTEAFGAMSNDATQLPLAEATQDPNNLSLEQHCFIDDLYPTTGGIAEQSVTARLAAVPVAEQVDTIENLAKTGGISWSGQERAALTAALDRGATIVADLGSGVPLVCGASPSVSPQSEIYVLSANGSGLLPPAAEVADHGDPPAKHGGSADSHPPTDATPDSETAAYHGSASNTLVGAMDDVVVRTPTVTLTRFVPADPSRARTYREAAQIALLPPRHEPAPAEPGEDSGTRAASEHYTDAERQLIMGLSRDPQIAASLAPLAGSSKDIAGARDWLALRFGREAMEPLANDDNLKRSTSLFHAIKKALEQNPGLKEIAEARFRQQLATMRPRDADEKPLIRHLSELDLLACLDDAEVMLDLVSAHERHELPLYAFAKTLPEETRADNAENEPRLEIT